MIQIDSAHVKGEPGTGFEERGKKGPFECGNCRYFGKPNACSQKTMRKLSKRPRHPNGDVVVDADDCCEYVDRIGKASGMGSRMAEAMKKKE